MTVLVTGGAGYLGSHMVYALPARRAQAFEVATLIEHEQRVIAGAAVMAVPDAHLLLAVARAHA